LKTTSDMAGAPQTVRILFCGGCNPEYDRVAAAERLRRCLADSPAFVLTEAAVPDMVIAVCGCDCACVDLTGLEAARIITVTSCAQVEDLLNAIRLTNESENRV